MRRGLRALVAVCFGLVACGDAREPRASTRAAQASDAASDRNLGRGDDADDTGRNERDRDGRTLTPDDQSNAASDVDITRQIRQKISDQDGLSTDAENVKIVTRGGVVTLRGPVENAEERRAIVELALSTQGVTRVDDQLEVATR